jgi:hypothetical protein
VKLIFKTSAMIVIMIYLAVTFGCGGTQTKPVTEPEVVVPKEPAIEELRKSVDKDPSIYKAVEVLKKYGRLTKEHISYDKYLELTGGQAAAIDPDWFYDSYVLDLNENGYWATVTFGTSKRAIERDRRIEKIMIDLPGTSIFMKLKTPSGRTYVLSDAEADGILDFVKDERDKSGTAIDIRLLDTMQEKYTWIIGLIKKHYKK